jgi:hypothetical protein
MAIMATQTEGAFSIQTNSKGTLASSFLLDGLAILLELLSKDEKLVSSLLTIFFFRYPLLSFTPELLTGLPFRTLDLWL